MRAVVTGGLRLGAAFKRMAIAIAEDARKISLNGLLDLQGKLKESYRSKGKRFKRYSRENKAWKKRSQDIEVKVDVKRFQLSVPVGHIIEFGTRRFKSNPPSPRSRKFSREPYEIKRKVRGRHALVGKRGRAGEIVWKGRPVFTRRASISGFKGSPLFMPVYRAWLERIPKLMGEGIWLGIVRAARGISSGEAPIVGQGEIGLEK